MPFYGLAVFVLFNLWEKGKIAEKIWLFLGKHSTNIWLTHMFFYLYIYWSNTEIAVSSADVWGNDCSLCSSLCGNTEAA